MSLYQDASLAMIPSAVKDGKLYSIRPADGSGDFTFSRGSNLAATRVDENGLIEKGRENLLLQSNNFATTWYLAGSATLTSGQEDKDGGTDAWLLTKTQDWSRIEQTISQTGVWTFSVFAKAGTSNWLAIENSGVYSDTCYFDLANGTKGSVGSGAIKTSIESAGNGWYRCSVAINGTSAIQRIYPATSNGNVNGSNGNIYIQDAQLELGLVATDYIETTTTTAQAGILEDMPRLDYSGGASCPSLLLEPQRTNLITQSEYINASVSSWSSFFDTIITNNDATSPEGVNNATKISRPIVGSARLDGIVSSLAAGTYTYSFYAKGDVSNLDVQVYQDATGTTLSTTAIEALINGSQWSRVTITFTSTTLSTIRFIYINLTAGEYFHLWGAMLESGSYPTSYIPTYGSSVTRSQEDISLNITDFDLTSDSITCFQEVTIVDGREESNNWFWILGGGGSTGWKSLSTTSAGFFQLNGNGSFSDAIGRDYGSGTHKMCFKYENGVGTVFVDGVKYADTSVDSAHPTLFTNMYIRGWYQRMMWKQLAVFPTALTDSECIALTTL